MVYFNNIVTDYSIKNNSGFTSNVNFAGKKSHKQTSGYYTNSNNNRNKNNKSTQRRIMKIILAALFTFAAGFAIKKGYFGDELQEMFFKDSKEVKERLAKEAKERAAREAKLKEEAEKARKEAEKEAKRQWEEFEERMNRYRNQNSNGCSGSSTSGPHGTSGGGTTGGPQNNQHGGSNSGPTGGPQNNQHGGSNSGPTGGSHGASGSGSASSTSGGYGSGAGRTNNSTGGVAGSYAEACRMKNSAEAKIKELEKELKAWRNWINEKNAEKERLKLNINQISQYKKALEMSDSEPLTLESVKKAHRQMSIKYHPDRYKGSNAENIMQQANEAYEKLCNHIDAPNKEIQIDKIIKDYQSKIDDINQQIKQQEEIIRQAKAAWNI